MAFVFREEKLKKIRPNTALGPGQYLPITDTIIVKSNVGRAPFESSVKKFKPLFGENYSFKKGTPGPGNYYKNIIEEKSKKLENLANIKQTSQEENILQHKYLSKTGNNFKTKYNVNNQKEVLGFEVKEKRFKNVSNINPGPGEYFQNIKSENQNKFRAKSAIEINSKNKNKKNKFINKNNGMSVPSIPYNDNGFEIDDNNSLVKLEDPNSFLMFRGDKKESVGPGSYDLDNPKSWLKSGTSWSKMKVPKSLNNFGNKSLNTNSSKLSTRPQTALELSQNIVATHSTNSSISKSVMSRASTAKMLKSARDQRKWNMIQMRQDFKEETQKRRNNSNRIPLLANDYYEQMEKFSNKQIPGPGYYIDMVKESDFYKKSMPYPEFKQFFLSNNERFPESKTNEFLGPTTYYKENVYYNSAFNTGEIDKIIDINKDKETPFSTRAKRFTNNNNLQKGNTNITNLKTPGPGTYDPKIMRTIEPNKFSNFNNTFNFRQRRIGPSASELKWKMETPGPGEYINPYTATGTANTLLINGLYVDIRKGKEILRQKAKTQKPLREVGLNTPGAGTYDPDKVISIAYKNRKKAKERKENEKLKIAFDSHMKDEKQLSELKSNLGPGIYYKELPSKSPIIRSPFQNGVERMKDGKVGSGIEPGHYEIGNYFDWNKKTYNVSYL